MFTPYQQPLLPSKSYQHLVQGRFGGGSGAIGADKVCCGLRGNEGGRARQGWGEVLSPCVMAWAHGFKYYTGQRDGGQLQLFNEISFPFHLYSRSSPLLLSILCSCRVLENKMLSNRVANLEMQVKEKADLFEKLGRDDVPCTVVCFQGGVPSVSSSNGFYIPVFRAIATMLAL